MTATPREIPYSDEPINEQDRWWDRFYGPLLARMEAKYGHLLAHAPRPATPGDRPGAGGEFDAPARRGGTTTKGVAA